MKGRRHFRIYYQRWDGNIGLGIEEYIPGITENIPLFASIFFKQNMSDYELICQLIDTYCKIDGPAKIVTSQLVDRYTLDHLRTKYPDIVWRHNRHPHIYNVRGLSLDALYRRSTIIEKMEGE